MQRHDYGQIERHLATVVADEFAAASVDLAGVELGDQMDALVFQQRGERRRCDWLGERAVQGRGVSDLDLVADAAIGEVPVGEEAELERSNWALDGHVDDVDHELAAFEVGQGRLECSRTRQVVEREHLLVPARPSQAFGLVERQLRSGSDHQHVVRNLSVAGQHHQVLFAVHVIDA